MTDSIRSLVSQTLSQLGMTEESEPRETILIRDGNYCGRRFETDHGYAVWFVEEGEIKFYDSDGAVIRTVDGHQAPQEALRKAA